MRKILFLLLLLPVISSAQLNVDSLCSVLDRDYHLAGTKKYLMEVFTSYISTDSLDRYDLFLDSNHVLHNYIDLAIVHKSYDVQHRITLIEGFDSLGNRSYWDFPVKTIFRYVEDTVSMEMRKVLQEIDADVALAQNCNFQIDYEIYNEAKYNKVRYHIFSKDSTFYFTYSICSTGNACRRYNDVFFVLYKLADDKIHYTANFFFGKKLKLIDGAHSLHFASNWGSGEKGFDFSYAIISLDQEFRKTKVDYYNSKTKLVDSEDLTDYGPMPNGIIDVTVTKKLIRREKKQ